MKRRMVRTAVDVLWTARYNYPSGWRLQLHCHEYFQTIYFVSGGGVFVLGEQPFPIEPASLLLIKPNVVHGLAARLEVRTMDVKFRVCQAPLRQRLMAAPERICPAPLSISELFDSIWIEGEQRHPFYREMCSLYLTQILLRYLRSTIQPGLPSPGTGIHVVGDAVVQRAADVLRRRYAEPIRITGLAGELGCSVRALRNHFQSSAGIAPLRYLQQFRIERSKELIEYSDYTLKEIAIAAGFKNVHHFTRTFTRFEGVSPGAWRKKYRDGIRKDVCINPKFSNSNWTVPPPGWQVSAPTDRA